MSSSGSKTNTKPTVRNFIRSLTGFEEREIVSKFGATFDDLNGRETGRSLVFIQRRRAGSEATAAFDAAMSLTFEEVNDSFADETDDEDVDPEFAATPEAAEAGKDD